MSCESCGFVRDRRAKTRPAGRACGQLFRLFVLVVLGLSGLRPASAQQSDLEPRGESDAREPSADEIAKDVADLERHGRTLRRVVALIKPTVVHIDAEKGAETTGKADRRPLEETGSGVIIKLKDQFYVLTNRHVVKNAALNRIRIKLSDGRLLNPTKMWADRGTDVALLSIRGANLTAARVADSGKLEIGDFVLAVGSPFGLSHSVTFGIVSAKGRRDLQLGAEGVSYQDFIQTDAAINPGNSGGPLLNLRGEVVGINTAIASGSGGNDGIGFSIPINMAMRVVNQLLENGTVVRAYLGVHLDVKFSTETAQRLGLPRPEGARVTQVTSDSPAAAAKLQIDDVILEFDGQKVDDDNHLVNLVSLTPVGKEVPVQVFRRGSRMTVSIRVTEREKFESAPR